MEGFRIGEEKPEVGYITSRWMIEEVVFGGLWLRRGFEILRFGFVTSELVESDIE